jgi:phosphoribosylanthranilate isomerase
MVKVKICCIQSLEEARLAIRYGASALGLVSHMPSGPGVIDETIIQSIAANIPSHVKSFLLTSLTDPDDIIKQHKRFKTATIQLVDRISFDAYKKIRKELPDVELVQVIHITSNESVIKANQVAYHVDALLLDSGNPENEIKELGGTGRIHNWNLSRKICQQVKIPVWLAGGLNPGNVRSAIEIVKPYGVDVCNGVRTNGKLDPVLLKKFTDEIVKFLRNNSEN